MLDKDGEFREEAVAIVTRMGIKDAEFMDASELCEIIGDTTCKIVQLQEGECSDLRDSSGHELPMERRIKVKCGDTYQCWDAVKLDRKIDEDRRFAAKFSSGQKRRIEMVSNSVRKETVLPCHALSGNVDGCNANGKRCAYGAKQGGILAAMFGRTTTDGKCHLTKDYALMARSKCSDMDLSTLRAVALDINYNNLEASKSDPAYKKMSLYEQRVFDQNAQTMMQIFDERLMESSHETICAIVKEFTEDDYQGQWWVMAIRWLKAISYALGIANAVVTYTTMSKINDYLGLNLSRSKVLVITHFVNLIFWIIENGLVSWGMWMILFPKGREYLKHLFDDPVMGVFFLISMAFSGIHEPFLVNIDHINIRIPYEEMVPYMNDAGRIVAGVTTRKLNGTNIQAVSQKIGDIIHTKIEVSDSRNGRDTKQMGR